MVQTDGLRTVDPCAEARVMFERVLAAWAMDVLSLRRRGLDRPGHRPAASLRLAAPPATGRDALARAA